MGKKKGAKRIPEVKIRLKVFTEQQHPEPSRQADLCVGGAFVLTPLEFVGRTLLKAAEPSVRLSVSSWPVLLELTLLYQPFFFFKGPKTFLSVSAIWCLSATWTFLFFNTWES